MERRDFLGMAGVATAALIAGPATAASRKKRPGFLWGTAGAAYQVEGANVASDLWVMEHVSPPIFADKSGDACDVYHRFDEDIALAASLGFNTHRFGI